MTEYFANEGIQSIRDTYTDTALPVSERHQQIEKLDEQMAKLGALTDYLTQRLQPALRSEEPLRSVNTADDEKALLSTSSDVVTHLRHTAHRVSDINGRISALIERIDL